MVCGHFVDPTLLPPAADIELDVRQGLPRRLLALAQTPRAAGSFTRYRSGVAWMISTPLSASRTSRPAMSEPA